MRHVSRLAEDVTGLQTIFGRSTAICFVRSRRKYARRKVRPRFRSPWNATVQLLLRYVEQRPSFYPFPFFFSFFFFLPNFEVSSAFHLSIKGFLINSWNVQLHTWIAILLRLDSFLIVSVEDFRFLVQRELFNQQERAWNCFELHYWDSIHF